MRLTPLALERIREHLSSGQVLGTAAGAVAVSSPDAQAAQPGHDLVTRPAPDAAAAAAPVVATIAVSAAQLPRSVDNSSLKAFPEIRSQGQLGSCVSFANTYYQYTHEVGLLAGWDNKRANSNATKLSPKFTYNLTNGGAPGPTESESVYDVLEQHGALTWAEFPYSDDINDTLGYREWPRGVATWKSALRFKAVEHGPVPRPTSPEAMQTVKGLLLNGHVLAFSTFAGAMVYDTTDDDPNTTADDATAGQGIVTWLSGDSGGHRMTIVGYNDDIWVNLNNDENVDPGEKGAFKVANSWGTVYENGGFVWLAYDSVFSQSQVTGGPGGRFEDRRRSSIDDLTWVKARIGYQPDLLAEVTIATANRGDLGVTAAVAEPDRPEGFIFWRPAAFQGGGGLAFDGTVTAQPQAAAFAIDLTGIAPSYGDVRYQMRLYNGNSIQASLSAFTIVDRLRSGLRTTSLDPQVQVTNREERWQAIPYRFQDPARLPRLVASSSIDFGTLALGTVSSRPLMLENTGTGELIVSSLRIDMPLFTTKQDMPIRIPPGARASVDLTFAPAASQSETATLSVRSNNAASGSVAVPFTGGGTSSNDSAPFLVFVSQQNDAKDNSIAMRMELVSHAPMPARISNYRILYYFQEPYRDLGQLAWDTYWTNGPSPIGFRLRKVFMSKSATPRTADTALELTFPEGTTIYPGQSLFIEGNLHHSGWSWTFDETDDWSRYLRRDGLAEGVVVQNIENGQTVFGSCPELPAGAQQLAVTPNPVVSDANVTFFVQDPGQLYSSWVLELYRNGALQDHYWLSVYELGQQSLTINLGGAQPGRYSVVLKWFNQVVDYAEIQKQ